MTGEVSQYKGSKIKLVAAVVLSIGSDTVADYLASKIGFANKQYEELFRFSIIAALVLLALWSGVFRNPSVRSFFGTFIDVNHSSKTVRALAAQYRGLTLPITINGQERFPQWELPSIMCTLAEGVRRRLRAIYILYS